MGDAREEETQGGRGGGEQNEMRAENKRGRRTRHCRMDGTMQERLEDDKEREEVNFKWREGMMGKMYV